MEKKINDKIKTSIKRSKKKPATWSKNWGSTFSNQKIIQHETN